MALTATAKAIFYALRQDIAKIEGRLVETLDPDTSRNSAAAGGVVLRHGGRPQTMIATGVDGFDTVNPVPAQGLVEIHGEASRDAGAVLGFTMALAGMVARANGGRLLWMATGDMVREAGRPYAPGLAQRFAIPPDRLLTAELERLPDLLWAAEQAAGIASIAVVVVELRAVLRCLT